MNPLRRVHYAWTLGGLVVTQAMWMLAVAILSKKSLWSRLYAWDSGWYGTIVDHGYSYPRTLDYPYSNLAFFPWLPALGKVGTFVGLPTSVALEIAALLGSVLAVIMIAKCVAWVTKSPWTGVVTAWLWCIAPRSHVLGMAYTEGWFTAACATALYGVVSRRWWLAALGGAVAGLTRPSASVLVAALVLGALVMWIAQRKTGRDWRQIGAALAGGAAGALTFGGYFAYVGVVGDGPGAYLRVQEKWRSTMGGPVDIWNFVAHEFMHITTKNFHYTLMIFLGMAIYVALIVWMLKRRDDLYLCLYALGLLGLATVSIGHFFVKLRFMLPAFPVWIPLAAWLLTLSRKWQIALGVVLVGTWWLWTVHFVLTQRLSP